MRRKAEVFHDGAKIKQALGISNSYKIELYIDCLNKAEIMEVIMNHADHFRRILYDLYNARQNEDTYEKYNKIANSTAAMKFKGSDNQRIYCKEINNGGKKIVMVLSHHKKGQQLTGKIKNDLKTISQYEYDFKRSCSE